ncbi:MAG: NAD-dependent epimerase/dehydratase family protein [Dehalococcoidia bacterium]
MKRVLITGAEGNIGTSLREQLAGRYELRSLTLQPQQSFQSFVADIGNLEAITPAFAGVEAVVHMAGSPSVQTPWDDILHNNLIGAYNVFEAARGAGVRQIVYASSNHAVGMYEEERAPELYRRRSGFVFDHLAPLRPDSLYGVSKCFGEALGRYYSERFGISVYCLRIGSARQDDNPSSEDARHGSEWLGLSEQENLRRMAATWQSKRDLCDEIAACLEAEDVRFGIFYGVSDNPYRFWDLEHARSILGWFPRDRAPEP